MHSGLPECSELFKALMAHPLALLETLCYEAWWLGRFVRLDFHRLSRCERLGGWRQCILGSQTVKGPSGPFRALMAHALALLENICSDAWEA